MTGPALVKARQGPSTDSGSGHKHTPPTQKPSPPDNHLQMKHQFSPKVFLRIYKPTRTMKARPYAQKQTANTKEIQCYFKRLISLIMICLGISFPFFLQVFCLYIMVSDVVFLWDLCVCQHLCLCIYLCYFCSFFASLFFPFVCLVLFSFIYFYFISFYYSFLFLFQMSVRFLITKSKKGCEFGGSGRILNKLGETKP